MATQDDFTRVEQLGIIIIQLQQAVAEAEACEARVVLENARLFEELQAANARIADLEARRAALQPAP